MAPCPQEPECWNSNRQRRKSAPPLPTVAGEYPDRLHGYLRLQCAAAHINYEQTDSPPVLLRKLRQEHPALQDLGPRGGDIMTVLNASRAILDALLPLRNQATPAHPNEKLLGEAEAHLVINVSRSLHHYLDAKLGAPTGADVAQTLFP